MKGGRLQITLEPEVLQWARERAGFDPPTLAEKVGVKPARVAEWERTGRISVSQADRLALKTHTPLGFLYLTAPPAEQLPFTDFRTVAGRPVHRPSPELLDTIHAMKRRQDWMRDVRRDEGAAPLSFVQSVSFGSNPVLVAQTIRASLGLTVDWAEAQPSWREALRYLRDAIEEASVLVVINGIVGNDTHRPLDVDEFRGFALVDAYAPLIFVNGADFKSPQMFTLAHELVHIWIGTSGVSNLDATMPAPGEVETFCNSVAAEFLLPSERLRAIWTSVSSKAERFNLLARRFKVSGIVAARRCLDLGLISLPEFRTFYQKQTHKESQKDRDQTGGNFWNSQNDRVGRRFGAAVIRAVREGRLLYTEAYSLTGLRGKTFDGLVAHLDKDR